MQRILVPIDFSDATLRAIDFARQIAQPVGAKIFLLTVETKEVDFVIDHQRMRGLVDGLIDAGFDAEAVHLTGDPASRIIETIDDKEIDLVVMGTHGRGATVSLLVGSVADAVVRGTNRPVLLVPDPKKSTRQKTEAPWREPGVTPF